mgnify:FL=1
MSIQSFYDTEPTSKNLDIIANEPEYNVHRGITYYLNRLMSSAAGQPLLTLLKDYACVHIGSICDASYMDRIVVAQKKNVSGFIRQRIIYL